MGMAASQGRLLFMTARISNNEFEQQCVAYSKQRLADDSQKANDQYLDALQATQYQIITGYNGDTPNYEPVTYNELTALNSVAARKQYIVSDNKGQILVTKAIASAFGNGHNDFNAFLKQVGNLTQVEKSTVTEKDVHEAWDKYFVSINKGHDDGIYYDESLKLKGTHALGFAFHESKPLDENKKPIANAESVVYATYNSAFTNGTVDDKSFQIFVQEGVESNGNPYYYYDNIPVEVESYLKDDGTTGYAAKFMAKDYFGNYNMMDDDGYVYLTGLKITSGSNGYTFEKEDGSDFTYKDKDGNTQSSKTMTSLFINQDLGSYSSPNLSNSDTIKTTSVTNTNNTIFYEGTTAEQRELYDYAMAVTEKYAKGSSLLQYDADKVQYYKNIYQQMITKGFTTFGKMIEDKYINTLPYKGPDGSTSRIDSEELAYKNDNWLITMLKNGKLSIAFYDSNNDAFIDTTLDEDESIVEKENKSKMAIAEQAYKNHMDKIEHEDKRFDMQLSKLESEHNALTTEYESVAKVISKNVEKSFNIFNA